MPREILGLKMYDVKEIAKMLSVTERTVVKYLLTRKLQGQKVGGKWYVSEENMKRFLEGQTT
jgi:excisionase family DNA binding protein